MVVKYWRWGGGTSLHSRGEKAIPHRGFNEIQQYSDTVVHSSQSAA